MSRYVFGKLYAEPSFIEGLSRTLDIGGTLQAYNTSQSEAAADTSALKNDWRAVGADLQASIAEYERQRSQGAK
jgi:hypothetical protein